MTKYKLMWEQVLPFGEGSKDYNGDEPNAKPKEVPERCWSKSERESEKEVLLQQYETLKKWSISGEQLVRKVKLFKLLTEPVWSEV